MVVTLALHRHLQKKHRELRVRHLVVRTVAVATALLHREQNRILLRRALAFRQSVRVLLLQEHLVRVRQLRLHRLQAVVQRLHAILCKLIAHHEAASAVERQEQVHRTERARTERRQHRLALLIGSRRQHHRIVHALAVTLNLERLRKVHEHRMAASVLRRERIDRQQIQIQVVQLVEGSRRELPAQRQLLALRRLRERYVIVERVRLRSQTAQRRLQEALHVRRVVGASGRALLHPLVVVRRLDVLAAEHEALLHAHNRLRLVLHLDVDEMGTYTVGYPIHISEP